MDRAKFEELIAGHLADIEKVMVDVLNDSKLKPEEIYRLFDGLKLVVETNSMMILFLVLK